MLSTFLHLVSNVGCRLLMNSHPQFLAAAASACLLLCSSTTLACLRACYGMIIVKRFVTFCTDVQSLVRSIPVYRRYGTLLFALGRLQSWAKCMVVRKRYRNFVNAVTKMQVWRIMRCFVSGPPFSSCGVLFLRTVWHCLVCVS